MTTNLSSSSNGASLLSESQSSWTSDDQNLTIQVDNFPENMTVHDFLLKLRDDAKVRIMDLAQNQVKRLREEYQRQRDELLQEGENKRIKAANTKSTAAAKDPFKILTLQLISKVEKDDTPVPLEKEVIIKVGGPKSAVARVGRSQGKHYMEKGISLHWDLEVSTSHGQFKVVDDEVVFEDLGSTNRSYVNSTAAREQITLEAGMRSVIRRGDRLQLGATTLDVKDIRDESV